MIKVLIVDDEPKLREGLKFFIDWESYGYLVVDTAANGYDALSKYEQHHPDVVIADIRMPGMDGIQLIKALREQDNDLHILILSGYADFDYAKKAITHRADGYLLKPVDEEELISYLETIKQAIEAKQLSKQWSSVTKEWTREAVITTLLESPTLDENEDVGVSENEREQEVNSSEISNEEILLYEQAEELGLLWTSYQILLVSLSDEDEANTTTSALLKKKLVDLYENTRLGYVFTIHSQIGVLLKKPLVEVELEGLYSFLEELLIPRGAHFVAAVGSKVHSFHDIKASFEEANHLLRQHFILETGVILRKEVVDRHVSEQQHELDELEEVDPDSFIKQLYYAIDVSNQQLMKQLISRMGQKLVTDGCNEKMIKQRFVEILNVVLNKFMQKRIELQSKSKPFVDAIADVYEVHSLQQLYTQVHDILLEMMSSTQEDGKHREVKVMLDLIHRNYNDNLKLETLAGVFNYNSAYLGKLFKNETGEYFNTYVDKVRIEKAKDFLEQGYKVYQVAEKVGYTNVDYFHTKFRKYVGTSPSAYRKESEASS